MRTPKAKKGKTNGDRHQKTVKQKAAPAKVEKPAGKMSALAAAYQVLLEVARPMQCKDLINHMAEMGYWTSPGGKTPHATLNAAMLREIKTKGKDSRFVKAEKGKFAAKGGA